jgi:hypothetical protein
MPRAGRTHARWEESFAGDRCPKQATAGSAISVDPGNPCQRWRQRRKTGTNLPNPPSPESASAGLKIGGQPVQIADQRIGEA